MLKVLVVISMFYCITLLGEVTDAVVFMKEHNEHVAVKLVSSDKAGNLSIESKNGFTIINADSYRFVRLAAKPKLFEEAEKLVNNKKYKEAEKLIKPLMNNYNFQNAEINAKLLASKIQLGLGNSNAALDTLKNVVEAAPSDPENENRFYSEAYYLIAFIFNNKGDSEKALPYYIKCAELAIPAFSGKANFELGQNALKQKKYNIALRYFLRNVLLYKPDTAGRKDSLVLVIDIMTKSKDKRLPTYQDILKRDYPDFK